MPVDREVISSSEIEGAKTTTRELARQMVREQRAPASRGERMIWNNWRAMQRILELRNQPLSIDDLLEHSILGEGALEGLRERVAGLLKFANGATGHSRDEVGGVDRDTFIHPIVRAIIVHLWIGYEHPFRDSNGRLARALYYYCTLRQG